MDRETFSEMLLLVKERSGMTATDLMRATGDLPSTIWRMESARVAYPMSRALAYIDATGYVLCLSKDGRMFRISGEEELAEWLRFARGMVTETVFSSRIGCGIAYLKGMESGGRPVPVDVFLKAAEVAGFKISLVKK